VILMSDESPETKLALLEQRMDTAEKRVDKHDTDIGSLKLWRGWVTGSAATIMFFVGLFASQLKKLTGN